jgi:hypothetical protein
VFPKGARGDNPSDIVAYRAELAEIIFQRIATGVYTRDLSPDSMYVLLISVSGSSGVDGYSIRIATGVRLDCVLHRWGLDR